MLSQKRLSESKNDPTVPQTASAQRIARCFPVIWSALVLATVVMASLIYATLQTPHVASGHSSAPLPSHAGLASAFTTQTSTAFQSSELACAASEVVVRHTPSESAVALFTAQPAQSLRIVSATTFTANGIAWIGVTSEKGRSGYLPERALTKCDNRL